MVCLQSNEAVRPQQIPFGSAAAASRFLTSRNLYSGRLSYA